MKLLENLKIDWLQMRGEVLSPIRFYIYLFLFAFIYGLGLSFFAQSVPFFLAIFRLHFLGLFKEVYVFIDLLILWMCLQVFLFFIINPFFVRLLQKKNDFSDQTKKISLSFLSLFLTVFFMWTPFFLILCFILIFTIVYFMKMGLSFSFKSLFQNWKTILKEGCLTLLPFLLPFLGLLFLPRIYKRFLQ